MEKGTKNFKSCLEKDVHFKIWQQSKKVFGLERSKNKSFGYKTLCKYVFIYWLYYIFYKVFIDELDTSIYPISIKVAQEKWCLTTGVKECTMLFFYNILL